MSETELAILRAAQPDVVPVVVKRSGDRLEIAAGPCPYLRADRCTVYSLRPWWCRVYACFRGPDVPWTDGGVMGRRLAESQGVRRVWQQMLEDARGWGLAHGWVDEHGDPRP